MIAYKEHRRAIAIIEYPDGMTSEMFWSKAKANAALSNCDWNTARNDPPYEGQAMVTCDNRDPYSAALLWALLPAALMAAFVNAVRLTYSSKHT